MKHIVKKILYRSVFSSGNFYDLSIVPASGETAEDISRASFVAKSGILLYICNVFFIVLDLRLTKVGVQRYSFFFDLT